MTDASVVDGACQRSVSDPRFALVQAERRIENLERALQTSRVIGMAMGILIERHRITKEQAFELLATVSQRRQVKVHALADEILFTGLIAEPDMIAEILDRPR